MNSITTSTEPEFAAWIGIDWSDRKHDFALLAVESGQREQGVFEHRPEAIEQWANQLRFRFQGRPVGVCLEQSRGPLLNALAKYDFLVLYPVNPLTMKRLRQAFAPSGAKDDPPDANLLLDLLLRHRDRLPVLHPDTAETRCLQLLVEHRRRLVEERKRQILRLIAELKQYFPLVLELFDEFDRPLVMDFLRRWPTLEAVQRARDSTLLRFFQQHGCWKKALNQKRLGQIRDAVALTRDRAVIDAAVCYVQALVGLIQNLRNSIAQFDQQIEQRTRQHMEFPLFDSFPGAGAVSVSRLIVAFGTRRENYSSAEELQQRSGIAPVVIRSGKKQQTRFRYSCSKFLRQTFHEWAHHSIAYSTWAKAFYDDQREKGKDHQAAVRALAFKWIRIAYRCWKDRRPYCEQTYLTALIKRQSPLIQQLPHLWISAGKLTTTLEKPAPST